MGRWRESRVTGNGAGGLPHFRATSLSSLSIYAILFSLISPGGEAPYSEKTQSQCFSLLPSHSFVQGGLGSLGKGFKVVMGCVMLVFDIAWKGRDCPSYQENSQPVFSSLLSCMYNEVPSATTPHTDVTNNAIQFGTLITLKIRFPRIRTKYITKMIHGLTNLPCK